MTSKLNDHQLNIDCYMQKRLYTNPMMTIHQKPLVNMERIKKKKSKYITKESQQILKDKDQRNLQNQRQNK